MSPDVAASLAPLQDAVHTAQIALDQANRDPSDPLGCLAPAGRLIAAHAALNALCIDLLSCVGAPVSEDTLLRIRGQINRADTLATEGAPR